MQVLPRLETCFRSFQRYCISVIVSHFSVDAKRACAIQNWGRIPWETSRGHVRRQHWEWSTNIQFTQPSLGFYEWGHTRVHVVSRIHHLSFFRGQLKKRHVFSNEFIKAVELCPCVIMKCLWDRRKFKVPDRMNTFQIRKQGAGQRWTSCLWNW